MIPDVLRVVLFSGRTWSMLHSESTGMGTITNSDVLDGKCLGRPPSENGHIAASPKYKRRKVFGIRDFPTECGRFSLEIISTTVNEAGCAVNFENSVIGKGVGPSSSNPGVDVDEAQPGVDKPQAQVSKPINLEYSGIPFSDVPIDFKDKGIVESAPPLEDQPAMELSTCPSEMLVTSHEKTNICKYPPRRRVSAVRDFPPFCGRNAILLGAGRTEVAADTESKSLVLDKSGLESKPKKETGTHFVQVQDGGTQPLSLGSSISTHITDEVQTEADDPDSRENKIQNESEASSDNVMKRCQKESQHHIGSLLEDIQQKYGLNTDEDRHSCSSRTLPPNQYHINEAADFMEENCDKALTFVSEAKTQESHEDSACLNFMSEREVIVGLRALGNGPGRKAVTDHKPKSVLCDMAAATRGRRHDLSQIFNNTDLDGSGKVKSKNSKARNQLSTTSRKNQFALVARKSSVGRMPSDTGTACQGLGQVAVLGQDNNQEHAGANHNFHLVRRATNSVNLPPRPASLVDKADDNDSVVCRRQVRETLRLFHAICRKLLQAKESKQGNAPRRIDLHAAGMLKGKFINHEKVIGSVPGVEVGDEFQYRIELNIIGLHHQTQGGIDYVKQGKKILCSSIVASGGYDDNMDDSDVLVYTGQGGNITGGDKQPEDQKLEKGNLALKNSADEKNPVRVIRGDTKTSDDGKARTYIYDGLYDVERWWQEMGQHGKLVFKFKLVRRSGQAPLAWKVVKKSKKFKVREGLCADDISNGKEVIPICAVNTVDDEKPPVFQYITRMIYPDCVDLMPAFGCGCTDGCTDHSKCTCVAKNGGEIPYNHNGAIVEAKPLVHECGPSCKCPPSCHNRVSQNGIRFQLEIFKTESRGWGVRSLNSIPSGSFICEYIGELLEDKEAEQRTGNDEYLFDIGNQYDGASLHNELSSLMPAKHSSSNEVVEDGSFTIDAAQYGNIGRFINHSCSPNLYAQNVVYDHVDKRIPHIMLFAAENIPPLQELTYHYNYAIDQVRGSDGSIKKKNCYCGSPECTGRMY